MGSVAKVVKKVTKVAKKPFSKITKGIARGIAKVGKSVMRGVGKINKKFGPLGSIALAVAMPYAMGGLSNMIGHGGMAAGQASGWMGSQNVFLRSIGNVGNAIRTGYTQATGAISKTFSTITRSISEGFSSFGKGNNIFSKISNGAKNLFNKARATVRRMKPMTSKGGSVDVYGLRGGPHGEGLITSSVSNVEAAKMIEAGIIQPDQLSGQSWGNTGWLTKANPADKAIAETINSAYESNIMSNFNGSANKAFLDYKKAFDASGQKYNYQDIHRAMNDNFTNHFDKIDSGKTIGFDFNKSGDFTYQEATMRGNPHLESGQSIQDATYKFNGDKTFSANGKKTLNKKSLAEAMKGKALSKLSASLLTPSERIIPDVNWSLMGDMSQQTDGSTVYGGTTIKGSSGGNLLEGVYNKDMQERILNYYRHMNIVGSH